MGLVVRTMTVADVTVTGAQYLACSALHGVGVGVQMCPASHLWCCGLAVAGKPRALHREQGARAWGSDEAEIIWSRPGPVRSRVR